MWGEPGGNRGRPKEPGENRGHLGREPGENRGLLVFICIEYRGRSGGFGTRTGGEPGGGNFLSNSVPENQRTGPPVKISISQPKFRNGPNTVSASTVSNTELSSEFCLPSPSSGVRTQ